MMKYNNLNDYFKKLYVINLDRRPDRYQECQLEFQKIGIDVERISGIDGKSLSATINLNPKQRACYGLTSTHVKIIRDAISNKYENIMVFEDDVKFIDNFNTIFTEKIEFLPEDWDLLYLGGNHILYVPGFNLITGDKNFKITKENYRSLNHELCKTPCTWCAHAVGINSKFYDKILRKIKSNPVECIDVALYNLQQEGCNAYTFLPSLAIQKPSFSDIEGFRVDYGSMPQVTF